MPCRGTRAFAAANHSAERGLSGPVCTGAAQSRVPFCPFKCQEMVTMWPIMHIDAFVDLVNASTSVQLEMASGARARVVEEPSTLSTPRFTFGRPPRFGTRSSPYWRDPGSRSRAVNCTALKFALLDRSRKTAPSLLVSLATPGYDARVRERERV